MRTRINDYKAVSNILTSNQLYDKNRSLREEIAAKKDQIAKKKLEIKNRWMHMNSFEN